MVASSFGNQHPKELPQELLMKLYYEMVLIRRSEEVIADLLTAGEIKCPTHLYIGQEAIAVGACAALETLDYLFGTHRSHGHFLAKGGGLDEMMAELYGKSTGCARGRGGSMHLVAPEVGILGTSPIVGASLPFAVGTAWASQLRNDGLVSVVFFGDGAVEEGVFHECLNFAALRRLPVIFVCENNLYSSHLHIDERQPENKIHANGEVHSMPGVTADGNDVLEILAATRDAVALARAGEGPTLIEARTYRWRGHVGPNWDLDKAIRTQAEVDAWIEKDPIKKLRAQIGEGAIGELDAIDARVETEVERSVELARAAPYPDPKELDLYVLSN